jgi:hypothetical protein
LLTARLCVRHTAGSARNIGSNNIGRKYWSQSLYRCISRCDWQIDTLHAS